MSIEFDAEDQLLRNILTGQEKYKIPKYQRPYSWTSDEVSDLWNDLKEEESTFLGSFVFNYEKYEEEKFVEVIDGQQRLITFTILMAVLRDIYKELGDEDKFRLTQETIAHKDFITGKETYRLECGDSLNSFFCENIQRSNSNILISNPREKEKKAIKENYKLLKEKITSELNLRGDKSKKIDYLDNLKKKIFDYKVILIKTGSDDDAYSIFETVNARGADLTIADLLKNYLFSKLPQTEESIKNAQEIWSTIENNVNDSGGRLTVSKFIRYFWLSKYSFVQEKKLYREVKKEITDPSYFLLEILKASEYYYKIANDGVDANEWVEDLNDKRMAQKIVEPLNGLRVMGITQCYSLMLCLLMNIDKIGFNFIEIFKDIEKYHFGYSAICKLSGNVVEKIYYNTSKRIQWALKIENQGKRTKVIEQELINFKKELKNKYPSRAVFIEKFMDVEYKKYPLVIYILSSIENFKGKITEEIGHKLNKTNIEHILPQDPTEWQLSKKDVKEYVHRLGNLTLTSPKINGPMGNKPLKEKLKFFKLSKLNINKELVERFETLQCKWDEEEINKYQRELAEYAYDHVWKFK